MTTIVAILGDYYYPWEWARDSLKQTISQYFTKEDINISYYSHEQLHEALALMPDAVILFKENRLNPTADPEETWMSEEFERKISEYVANGGSWLAWHSGLASYPADSVYTGMLKGYFLYHPEKHQLVHYKSINHTVLSESISFEIQDEHYFVQCNKEDTNVFLVSESIDGQSEAGWYHTYGKGKVCCLTTAHNRQGLMDPEFQRIVGNCLDWLIC